VSLKVDNLTYRTTPEMLKRVFEKYGDVGDVYIPRDAHTNDSRGFAFVRYYDERDADDAIDRLNGSLLDGRELRVQLAKHARPPQSASYSRRYGLPPRRSQRRYCLMLMGHFIRCIRIKHNILHELVTTDDRQCDHKFTIAGLFPLHQIKYTYY